MQNCTVVVHSIFCCFTCSFIKLHDCQYNKHSASQSKIHFESKLSNVLLKQLIVKAVLRLTCKHSVYMKYVNELVRYTAVVKDKNI